MFNPNATTILSFEYKDEVKQNYEEAVRYYRLAADQGYAPAQYGLACMYRDGLGVAKDEQEAARLFQLVAAANLGLCSAYASSFCASNRTW